VPRRPTRRSPLPHAPVGVQRVGLSAAAELGQHHLACEPLSNGFARSAVSASRISLWRPLRRAASSRSRNTENRSAARLPRRSSNQGVSTTTAHRRPPRAPGRRARRCPRDRVRRVPPRRARRTGTPPRRYGPRGRPVGPHRVDQLRRQDAALPGVAEFEPATVALGGHQHLELHRHRFTASTRWCRGAGKRETRATAVLGGWTAVAVGAAAMAGRRSGRWCRWNCRAAYRWRCLRYRPYRAGSRRLRRRRHCRRYHHVRVL
jgi:hypothetical protein